MFIHVVPMGRMHVSVVEIIDVTVVKDGGMATVGAVYVQGQEAPRVRD